MKSQPLTMSRNQNFKSYGRGKHSNHPGTVVNSSIQFDKFILGNVNKPTASKSAGTIGKWGMTSFTSLRSSSFTVGAEKSSRFSSLGKKRAQPSEPDVAIQSKRPALTNNTKRDASSPMLSNRKFFKSRNSVEDPNQKTYKSSEGRKQGRHAKSADENKKQKNNVLENQKKAASVSERPTRVSSKKAAAAAAAQLKIIDQPATPPSPESYQNVLSSPTKERDKPPIVLRIFKGTSQLMSETGNRSSESSDEGSPTKAPQQQPPPPPPSTVDVVNNAETLKENIDADSMPEPAAPPPPSAPVTSRTLRRRSPEEVVAACPPEPTVPAPVPATKSRRLLERVKSPSPPVPVPTPAPEPAPTVAPAAPPPKTRTLRRRSPPAKAKSKSPSPEPTITTRSLRRRPAPTPVSDLVASSEPPPHTSPKRALRSAKNALPPPPPPPATGKIVITNLHSDHPSVVMSNENGVSVPQPPAAVAATASPPRREPKEHRSYTNKLRHRTKNDKNEQQQPPPPPPPPPVVAEPKVEDLLANIAAPNENNAIDEQKPIDGATSETTTTQVPAAETSLDDDRAELLQLLEDDEDVTAGEEKAPSQGNRAMPESQLKIKIKLPKLPLVKEEPAAVVEATHPPPSANVVIDSQDSGIDLKSDVESYSETGGELSEAKATTACEDDRADSSLNCESDASGDNIAVTSAPSAAAAAAATSKKGSFFKHRSSNDGNKKRLGMALYKHKWVDDKEQATNAEEDKNANGGASKSKTLDSMLDMDVDDDMPLTKFIRQPAVENFDFDESPPVMGIKCSKKNKNFYTVVRNVKKAHQIQESGEFQEFNDDVDYILDALQDNMPIGTRCLSAITLATKCTEPAFRMHVRAHGTVTKFFRALHDATKDQSLGLCTATVMFVLSQDRLNMDLDRDSLELMLNLLESDASHTKALEDCGLTDSQLTKTKDKVRQICADIQAQGHAKHLNLDNITVGHLSMETLLSLTSKRAGEWFKEELRELGGLEHIIKTVNECCKHVDDTANAWSATSLEKIRKVDRCLRVLENVTMLNEQNNDYLLEYQNGILIDTLVRMFKVCDYEIPLYPTYSITDKESTGAVLRECLIANLKVLINVTHDYQKKSNGSSVIGSRPGVIESSLHVLLQVPQYIPKEEKFDLMLLTLIMLINLVEHCDSNRKAIVEAKAPCDEESIFETKEREPAVKALISMFYNYEELARNEEKKTDAILEGENAEKPPTNAPQKAHEDFIEETISQLVQKAGQNMEHTLIAAYVAMLIGYLIIDNEEYEKFVRNHLPEKNFQFMITVLQKFYSFMTLTASGGTVSNRDMKSIHMVIQKLIESDHRQGFDPQTSSQGSSAVECAKSGDESQSANPKTVPAAT